MKKTILVLLLTLVSAIISYADNSIQQPNLSTTSSAKVTDVQSLKSRSGNYALLGDKISVKVSNLNSLISDSVPSAKYPFFLVFNGKVLKDISSEDIDSENKTITFYLDSTQASFKNYFRGQSRLLPKGIQFHVSINVLGTTLTSDVKNFKLYNRSPYLLLKSMVFFILVSITLFFLIRYTNVMRLGNKDTAFSLAQSQLAFWTVIISLSTVYIWIVTEHLPEFTPTILALLGISGATTAASKLVDYANKGQVKIPRNNFLKDILSNNDGGNIQRFQILVWTLILGGIFIIQVLLNCQFCNFNEDYLLLMGISSGIYVFLKFSEDKNPAPESKK